MTKTWPADNQPVNFEELVKPFVKSIRFAYDLKRKNIDKDIVYDGYEHGSLHVSPGINTKFTQTSLAYDLEEQGRDALEVIIAAAIQVGIEQGRRVAMDSLEVRSLKIFETLWMQKENQNNL